MKPAYVLPKHCLYTARFNFVHLDKPGGCENIQVSDIGSDNCTLSWSTPTDNGGLEITGNDNSILDFIFLCFAKRMFLHFNVLQQRCILKSILFYCLVCQCLKF